MSSKASSLMVIATNACNFDCHHCLREQRSPDHLEVDVLDKALEQARVLGFSFIGLTGGEPILHPEIESIVQTVIKHGFNFNLNTNAWLWPRYIELINKTRRPENIGISLDGAFEQTHDQMRRSGSFQKVLEAIPEFRKAGNAVSITSLVTRLNIDEIEDMIALAKELGAFQIRFAGLIPTPQTQEFMYCSAEELHDVKVRASKQANKLKFHVKFCSSVQTLDGSFFCDILALNQPAINPLGEVTFCCDTIGRGAVVGSLYEKDFYDLYKDVIATGRCIVDRRIDQLRTNQEDPVVSKCSYCNYVLETKSF